VVAFLNFTCRESKYIPHPWALKALAFSLPCIYVSIIDIEYSFATNCAGLWPILTTKKLDEDRYWRWASFKFSTENRPRIEFWYATILIN
jgi:hypothetical protein